MQCVNKNLREYQTLKKESGLSDSELSHQVGMFLDNVGRYPYLDELDGANSEPAIKEDLKLNKDNITSVQNILRITHTTTIDDAIQVLNDKYRDKEIEIDVTNNTAKVFITERPGLNPKDALLYDPLESEMNVIKQKAIANGTFMKAPNGKDTNLTERQWLQVRTKNFKKWFGDWENDFANASKVIDENGEPLVVYRIDVSDFTVFDKNHLEDTRPGFYGSGFYFSNDLKSVRRDYSEPGRDARAFFLNMKDYDLHHYDEPELYGEMPKDRIITFEHADDDFYKEYIVKNPNQIKSATDNSGEFSTKINDITDGEVNSFHYFNEIIDKLNTLYGINVIPITNQELKDSDLGKIAGNAKAFIYNGDIYVNVDIATVDSPVHEFLHILFGSLKYSNRELYNQIVSQAEQFDTYGEISQEYPNRTREDVNEEIFVTELAKYLTGRSNTISKLPQNIQHEIFYNINRTLDTMLMGNISTRCISGDQLYQMNLKSLAQLVDASTIQNNFQTTLTNSALSRIMSNKKHELMNEGLLKEECS